MTFKNYYIAVLPKGEVEKKIRNYQKIMADRFSSERALRNAPHITLMPPFDLEEEKESKLIEVVKQCTSEYSSFELKLDGLSLIHI